MGGVLWYKLVAYVLLSANRRAYFCKSMAIEMGGVSRYFSKVREPKLNPNFFSQTFRALPGYPGKIPGYPAKKVWFPWISRGIPNFLAPTPSCGRPLPHQKISGLKSLGLGSFFVPEKYQGQGSMWLSWVTVIGHGEDWVLWESHLALCLWALCL